MTKTIVAVFCGILLSTTTLVPMLHGQDAPAPAPSAPQNEEPPAVSPVPAQPIAPEVKPAAPEVKPAEPEKKAEPAVDPQPAAPAAPVVAPAVPAEGGRPDRLGAPGSSNRPEGMRDRRGSTLRGSGASATNRVIPSFPSAPGVPPAQGRLLSAGGANAQGGTNAVVEELPTTFTTLELEDPDEIMPVGAWQIQNMPLDAFLDVYSDLVGRTVIRPATLAQAQINFKMKTPLTKRELVQALEGVLIVNQVSIIPSGEKFVTAMPLADAAGMGAKLNEMNIKEIPESLQFMTQIVQLTNAYPSEVVPSIQPFAKIPNGIVAIEDSKLVVIRDYAVNVKRMMEILKRVDIVPEDDYSFKVIPIRYGTVEDVNNVVSSLIGSSGSVGTSSTTRTGSNNQFGSNRGGSYNNRSSSSSRTSSSRSSSSRFSGAQANMQRLGGMGGGASTFQNRMGNIMNRASSGNQQVSLLMDSAQVIPDERSNSLIVYATKRDMKVITNVIAQLDFLLPQVLIESVIVDVTLGDGISFGVSAAQVRTNSADYKGLGGMMNGQNTYSTLGAGTNSPLAGLPGGFSYFGRVNDEWEFGVNAMASKNKATVLQRPRILTMHGVPATFFNGQRIPYASSSYYGGYTSSANVSFDYLDVGIQLDVTPFISSEKLVMLDISQTIDEFSSWVEMGNDLKAPQTVNRDATARIAVQDRESVMLGGFIRQSKSNSDSGVPFLKDIPLLGYLFRNTNSSKDRTELLVFIRPTILDSPETIRQFSETESKTLPGAYMALREYNRDTQKQMLSVLEEEKAIEIKEKKDLIKFQERMNKLDEKAVKSQEELDEHAQEKGLVELPPTDDPAITEIESKGKMSKPTSAPAEQE